jgi:hypothetical protein
MKMLFLLWDMGSSKGKDACCFLVENGLIFYDYS